MQVEPYLLED